MCSPALPLAIFLILTALVATDPVYNGEHENNPNKKTDSTGSVPGADASSHTANRTGHHRVSDKNSGQRNRQRD